jgi:CelD/BcsL family acetyltransferase involved in cellulose biosynthesis
VVAVEDVEALAEHRAAWDDLAAHALEPNPFYESWMLTPAWRAFGKGQSLLFLFVYLPDPASPQAPPRLCGLFPLQRRHYKRFPVLRLWQHLHCFLCTPLLRKDQAGECLAALFAWLRADPRGTALLELNLIAADGPFHRLLTSFLSQRRLPSFLEDSYGRAFWRPREDAETYLRLSLSSSGRQNFRRKRKRLGERGRLESTVLAAGGDVHAWGRQFLELEASGWKGKQHTALAENPAQRDYFLEITRSALARGQLQMLGLFLDGKPVALKCNFLAGGGAFVFKPAYDENFARFSPGALLELDNIRLCHQDPRVCWMDSCALPGHPLWDRLWMERRAIQTLLVSTGRLWGNLVVSLRPLMRWVGRLLRGESGTALLLRQNSTGTRAEPH